MIRPPALRHALPALLAFLVSMSAGSAATATAQTPTQTPPKAVFARAVPNARAISIDAAGALHVLTADRILRFDRGQPSPTDRTPNGYNGCDFRASRGIGVLPDGGYYLGGPCLQRLTTDRLWDWTRAQQSVAVAADAGQRVYLLSPEEAVLRFTPDGVIDEQWLAADLGTGRYDDGRDLAIDPRGFLYLTDIGADRVRRYDLEMHPVTSWELVAEGVRYRDPYGVTVDQDGTVYVTTLNPPHILKYTPDGVLLAHWGNPAPYGGSLQAPTDIAVNTSGDIFVLDEGSEFVMYGQRLPGDPPPIPPPPRNIEPGVSPPRPKEPGTSFSLQAALDAAKDGDTIVFPPGRYQVNLRLQGRSLHLIGSGGVSTTTLDGATRPGEPVIEFGPGSDGSILSNVTILGTNAAGAVRVGAPGIVIEDCKFDRLANLALSVQAGDVVVRRTSFVQCGPGSGTGGGGAIAIVPSVGSIGRCFIEDNTFDRNRAGSGGAIYVAGGALEFRRNRVQWNVGRVDGGGLFLAPNAGEVLIEENEFVNNAAYEHGGGIAARANGRTVIRNNLFARNTAGSASLPGLDGVGGALHLAGRRGTVSYNTIADNSATPACGGGGIAVGSPDWTIEKNIVAFNGTRGVIVWTALSPAVIRKNLIYGSGNFYENCTGDDSRFIAVFPDNLELDPLFCTRGGKYPVSENSPAIMEGDLWGASPVTSCPQTAVVPSTWSSIKARIQREP